jgi:hypothetical protein
MPVVINDFEAVAESPSASARGQGAATPATAAPLMPADLLRPLATLARRRARLRSH